MKPISEALIENSKSAIIGCVELHNKPIFSFRYEICAILAINGWELLLKAFISVNYPEVKLLRKDGTSKPFEECLWFVSSELAKDFYHIEENLNKIYEYRCNVIHFYKEDVDSVLYALLHKCIINYNDFLSKYFNIDLAEETQLMLLPIGFKPFATPVDFLTKESAISKSSPAIKEFIKSILQSSEKLQGLGIEDSILTNYSMAVINENRITNADIIAGITKDRDISKLSIAKKVEVHGITMIKTHVL